MLKLMKYEFRKLRVALLILLVVLAGLQLAFLLGRHYARETLWIVSLALTTLLVFGTYAAILVAGVASYYRELTNRTGYLVFMTPTRPISVVLSKLVFTTLVAIAATAVFGLAAYLDYAFLFGRLDLAPEFISEVRLQADFIVKGLFGDLSMTVDRVLLLALYVGTSALIRLMHTMCTAFLAVTLSVTLLQNKKNILRMLLSIGLFLLFAWGANWVDGRIADWMPALYTPEAVLRSLGASLGWNLGLSALFAWLSALLLKRKVSL